MKIRKISLFFDRFRPFHVQKDIGQIPCGFRDIGIESEIITEDKEEIRGFDEVPLVKAKRQDFFTSEFWRNVDSDVVIFVTWFHSEYIPILKRAKESRKIILLKGDTDGRITFPKPPRFWLTPHLLPAQERAKNILRILREILIYPRKIHRLREYLSIFDRIAVETPMAKENIKEILKFSDFPAKDRKKTQMLISKIDVIPSPVSYEVMNFHVDKKKKENIIISGANYMSYTQKNTLEMFKVVEMLTKIEGWKVIIAGEVPSNRNLKGDIFVGKLPHKDVLEILAKAKVSFLPSIYEGFVLFGAESLCMGCFLAITPIESAFFFAQKGGVFISQGFRAKEIFEAIKMCIKEFDEDKSREISNFWREKLRRDKIAKLFLESIDKA